MDLSRNRSPLPTHAGAHAPWYEAIDTPVLAAGAVAALAGVLAAFAWYWFA